MLCPVVSSVSPRITEYLWDRLPSPHIHAAALGRAGQTMTGCLRHGVTTWLVGEVILYEILGAKVKRTEDKQSGFELLEPGSN